MKVFSFFRPKTKSANRNQQTAKKTTIQETLFLWKELKSVREIAKIRMLTEHTIHNHLVKLVRAKEVEVTEILSQEKIQYLQSFYNNTPEISLSSIKEAVGEKLTWEELKLYKAAMETQN